MLEKCGVFNHKKNWILHILVYIYLIGNILQILNANPRLCNKEDENKTYVASLHSALEITVCVQANVSSEHFPVLKIKNKWFSRRNTSESLAFSWKAVDLLTSQYNLTIHFRNVTVYEYGQNTLSLLTGQTIGMDFIVTINPPGVFKMNFVMDAQDFENLKCDVNWFPKIIEITSTIGQMRISNNSVKQNENRTLRTTFNGLSICEDVDIYTCTVTDFKNKTYRRNLTVSNSTCPVKFCRVHDFQMNLNVTAQGSVNFTICLQNVFSGYKIKHRLKQCYYNQSKLASENTEILDNQHRRLLVNFSVNNIDILNNGCHQVEVIVNKSNHVYTLYKNITINVYEVPRLCNESAAANSKTNVLEGQNVTIKTCILDKSGTRSVVINKGISIVNDTSYTSGRRVYINQIDTGRYYLLIDIVNVSSKTPTKYEVKLTTFENAELIYTFEIIMQGYLRLCENEQNHLIVKAKENESLLMHLCYLTDTENLDYVGINSLVYPINKSQLESDIEVSVDKIQTTNNSYFMQIYFKTVSSSSAKNYSFQIKPSGHLNLSHWFQIVLHNEEVSSIFECEYNKSKIYYYTQLKRNVTICKTLLNDNVGKVRIKRKSYVSFGMRSRQLSNNVRFSCYNSTLLIEIVNVTDYNFGRYDVKVEFEEIDTQTFTFYLLQNDELPDSVCEDGTTNTTIYTETGSAVSFCFETFGQVDRILIINNKRFPISYMASNVYESVLNGNNFYNVTVHAGWNAQLKRRYIQVRLFPTTSVNLTLEMDSVERNLTYSILTYAGTQYSGTDYIQFCAFHQDKSFTVEFGGALNFTVCDSISYSENLFMLFDNLPIFNVSPKNKFYSIVRQAVNGSEIRKLILHLTNISNEDFGNSTILIMLDNRKNFSTTISIGQINPVQAKVPPDITYIIFTVPLVALALCLIVLLLVIVHRKKVRCKCWNTKTTMLQAKNTHYCYEEGNYVNVQDLQESEYMNLQLRRTPDTISMTNAPDLTKDLGPHMYSISADHEQETSLSLPESVALDHPSSGRYISNEGLVYVTISHANSLRSAASSKSSAHSDCVVYASLDMEKTGMMPLLQHGDSKHRRKKRKK